LISEHILFIKRKKARLKNKNIPGAPEAHFPMRTLRQQKTCFLTAFSLKCPLCEVVMKILSSLKGWKKRGDLKQIRRGKQIILIDPAKPKFKAKQGYKKS